MHAVPLPSAHIPARSISTRSLQALCSRRELCPNHESAISKLQVGCKRHKMQNLAVAAKVLSGPPWMNGSLQVIPQYLHTLCHGHLPLAIASISLLDTRLKHLVAAPKSRPSNWLVAKPCSPRSSPSLLKQLTQRPQVEQLLFPGMLPSKPPDSTAAP